MILKRIAAYSKLTPMADESGRFRSARGAVRLFSPWFSRGNEMIAVTIFAFMFVTIILQVTARYVFNWPLGWTEEAAAIAFIWLIFWVNALVIPIRRHVVFDIIYQSLGEQPRRIFSIVTSLVFASLFLVSIPATYEYFFFLGDQPTASLEVSFRFAFLTYFVFAIAFPVRLIAAVAGLLGKNWRDHI